MEAPTTKKPPPPPPLRPPLPLHHESDADEEDENVKQLNECSVIYLSLQECLVQTNRNWKSCQSGPAIIVPVLLLILGLVLMLICFW